MSKRAGEFITLDELLAEIGVDAARWFFAARGHTSGIDFDIELAKKQSAENPVYYVQYAHARIASILRKARTEAAAWLPGWPGVGVPAAGAAVTPAVTRPTCRRAEPRLCARSPASRRSWRTRPRPRRPRASPPSRRSSRPQFHAFYRDARVVDPADPERSAARLALVRATQLTLAARSASWGSPRPSRCRDLRPATAPGGSGSPGRWRGKRRSPGRSRRRRAAAQFRAASGGSPRRPCRTPRHPRRCPRSTG